METNAQKKEESLATTFDSLTGRHGLAIVLTDENSSALEKSNNNSMCEILYNSEEFAPHCEKFCGRAFEWATKAETTIGYKCYAGLSCLAIPLKKEEKQLVAIVGRAFTKADDYRNATSRAIEGDWRRFSANEFFENVLLSNSNENLEKLARQIEKINGLQKVQSPKSKVQSRQTSATVDERQTADEINLKSEVQNLKSKHWRSLLGSLLDLNYRQACFLILQFVAERFSIENLAWLERRGERLETIFVKGNLKNSKIQISLSANDERLLEAVKRETSLEVRERLVNDMPVAFNYMWKAMGSGLIYVAVLLAIAYLVFSDREF